MTTQLTLRSQLGCTAARRPGLRSRAAPLRAATRRAPTLASQSAIITGASSGLGLNATKALLDAPGDWSVVMACRDVQKGNAAAKSLSLDPSRYSVEQLDLADLDSVRAFAKRHAADADLGALVCNAAVYFPQATEPTFTKQGIEESVGVNHVAHYLLARLLAPTLAKSSGGGRCVVVGSVTGNTNTVAGRVPPMADLGDLGGLARKLPTADGAPEFIGAKAYKDSKVMNMLTALELDRRLGATGVSFSTLYPGCIADTPLFRNHNGLFRAMFPLLMKYVTKGYVTQEEAGRRLASIVTEDRYKEGGKYWSWRSGGDDYAANYNSEDRENAYANTLSEEASDAGKAARLWDITAELVGLPA